PRQLAVVVRRDPDEHAGIRAGDGGGWDTGVLERLPRDLEEEPLLRVDVGRLPGRDAEEQRVELVDAIEEAAPPAVGLAGDARVRVMDGARVPARDGDVADRVDAVAQQRPVRRR